MPARPTSPVGENRFGRIALALSGGGFRAAAFHLGTMKALHELDLLQDVRLLSTASGGSIIGARWVVSLINEHSFAQFESDLLKILRRNILAEALDLLHVGTKKPSLIQRAAEVYDGMFGGKRLGELADDENLTKRIDQS
jgi:predicted acylesterase/phospholipase RssA